MGSAIPPGTYLSPWQSICDGCNPAGLFLFPLLCFAALGAAAAGPVSVLAPRWNWPPKLLRWCLAGAVAGLALDLALRGLPPSWEVYLDDKIASNRSAWVETRIEMVRLWAGLAACPALFLAWRSARTRQKWLCLGYGLMLLPVLVSLFDLRTWSVDTSREDLAKELATGDLRMTLGILWLQLAATAALLTTAWLQRRQNSPSEPDTS